ncbi:MAG: Dabb family protein [Bacteroidota bacterium]
MKKILLCLLLLSVTSLAFSQNSESSNAHQNHQMEAKKLRHVVLFKFKDGTSSDDVKKVEAAFRNLPKKIKQIVGYEWGLNNSPENLNQGFTHCFFLTFNSEEDRAIYLPHPDHKDFGGVLGPHLDKVLVVDYWTKE